MKKVLFGNKEYNYEIDENGEETLTRTEIIKGKEIKIVLRGDSSRKFRRNWKIHYKNIKWVVCKKNGQRIWRT